MENIFSGAYGEDAKSTLLRIAQGGPDFGVVEHAVALLIEEGHVDADGVACAATSVSQNLLRLHKGLRCEERPRQKVAR